MDRFTGRVSKKDKIEIVTKPEVLLAPPFVRNGDLSVFWCGELSMSMQTVAAVGPAPTLGLRA